MFIMLGGMLRLIKRWRHALVAHCASTASRFRDAQNNTIHQNMFEITTIRVREGLSWGIFQSNLHAARPTVDA